MNNAMRTATPPVFVKSSNEGERRVMEGKYAYLAESTTVEYRTARNCDLMQVGQQLDSKGYGIGLPRGRDLAFLCLIMVISDDNFIQIETIVYIPSVTYFKFTCITGVISHVTCLDRYIWTMSFTRLPILSASNNVGFRLVQFESRRHFKSKDMRPFLATFTMRIILKLYDFL